MQKLSVYVILAGILLVLASGIHVAYTLQRMASLEPSVQFDLLPDYQVKTQLLAQPQNEIMPSIYFEVAEADLWSEELRYAYAFTSGDQSLAKGSGGIGQNDGGKNTKVRKRGQILQIERYLPTLGPRGSDRAVLVDIELDQPSNGAEVLLAQARFYLDPPQFRLSFLSLVLMWTLGILLVLVGALRCANSVKNAPSLIASGVDSERVRLWRMLCHLSALLGYIFPFGHVLGPLVVWMLRRDQIPGVEKAGRESLNFQLTVTVMGLIGVMLSVVFVGLVLLFLLVVFHFCMTLYASVRTQKGKEFTYPLTIRIINS